MAPVAASSVGFHIPRIFPDFFCRHSLRYAVFHLQFHPPAHEKIKYQVATRNFNFTVRTNLFTKGYCTFLVSNFLSGFPFPSSIFTLFNITMLLLHHEIIHYRPYFRSLPHFLSWAWVLSALAVYNVNTLYFNARSFPGKSAKTGNLSTIKTQVSKPAQL